MSCGLTYGGRHALTRKFAQQTGIQKTGAVLCPVFWGTTSLLLLSNLLIVSLRIKPGEPGDVVCCNIYIVLRYLLY
jgi:hypothetical protein